MANKKPEQNQFKLWLDRALHKRIRTLRLISQVAFFFLFNGVIFGLSRISLPVPVSMPAGAPLGTVWGGLDAIQYIMSSGQFPFLAFGIFFLTGAILGKFTCGWVCPIGLWQDILSWFPIKKIKLSKPDNDSLQEIGEWLLWIFLIITGYVGIQNAKEGPNLVENIWTRIPYGVLDPAGTMFVTWFYAFFWGILPGTETNFADLMNQLGWLFFWKTLILLVIAFISLKIPRAYCRWICPTGTLLGYTSKNSILTVKRNPVKCTSGCTACEDACPTEVPILDEDPEGISNTLCINCGNCIDACPDAMAFTLRI